MAKYIQIHSRPARPLIAVCLINIDISYQNGSRMGADATSGLSKVVLLGLCELLYFC